jgi:hypothetical protein
LATPWPNNIGELIKVEILRFHFRLQLVGNETDALDLTGVVESDDPNEGIGVLLLACFNFFCLAQELSNNSFIWMVVQS